MKGALQPSLSQPLAALAPKTASGGKIRARRFAPAWRADKPLYRFGKTRHRAQTRVGAPILANTIGNLVADGIAGNNSKELRQQRIAGNADGLRKILPGADLSGFDAAATALADNPNSSEAKGLLEYEARKLLIGNRGNAAVEDLINSIGGSLPKDYLASGADIFVQGDRNYLVGSLIDNSGIWLGEKQQQIGSAVGEFMDEHPGAALAARLFDTGVAAVAPIKYLGAKALDYGKDGISDWIADKMEGPRLWSADKAEAGGNGAVFAGAVFMGGIGALKGGINFTESATVRARRLGREGEAAAGITGSKIGVEINGRMRFPDEISPTTIKEVKNVGRQGWTRQLKDYSDLAKSEGKTFELWIRPETRVSRVLEQARRDGNVVFKFIGVD